jgi:hypothetical protein
VPLTDDQRAMLRLLAQREEGYEDIAALKGMSVEEVRAEVKAALAQLAAGGEKASEERAGGEPGAEEAAGGVEAEASDILYGETPPRARAPRPRKPSSPVGPGSKRPRPRGPRFGVAPERRRLLALAGGALGIVAVVLIAIAVFGDDSDSGSAGSSGASAEAAIAENSKITQAALEPVDGSSASGRAVFGRLGKEVVLQVTGEDLEPTAEGESYTVWLYRTPKLTIRVGSVAVDDSGRLAARFPIPAELLAYVAGGAFDQIYVSRTSDAEYQREVAQAKKNKTLPRYTGETVLTGEITGPVVKAGNTAGG